MKEPNNIRHNCFEVWIWKNTNLINLLLIIETYFHLNRLNKTKLMCLLTFQTFVLKLIFITLTNNAKLLAEHFSWILKDQLHFLKHLLSSKLSLNKSTLSKLGQSVELSFERSNIYLVLAIGPTKLETRPSEWVWMQAEYNVQCCTCWAKMS